MRDGWANFFLGLGIGVGVGMLIAPKTGEETRGMLKSKANEGTDFLMRQAEEGKEYLKKQTADLRESAGSLVDKGKDALSRQKDVLGDALQAGKQAYRDKVEQPLSTNHPV